MATRKSTPLDLESENDKYFECVDGQLLERESGSRTHSDLQYKVVSLLKPVAGERNAHVHQEWTLIRGDDWMTPDVMFSFPGHLNEDSRGYLIGPAFLVIEILSPSQSQVDLFRKCARYFSWGVPHCWVIDPRSKACFEYHGGNDFILADTGDFLNAGDLRIPVADIFADLP